MGVCTCTPENLWRVKRDTGERVWSGYEHSLCGCVQYC